MHDATPPDHIVNTDQSAEDLNDGIDYIPVQLQAATAYRVNTARLPEFEQAKRMADAKKATARLTKQQSSTDQRMAAKEVSGKEVLQQAMLKLLGLARREVLLVVPAMHELLDNEQIGQSLLDFVRFSAKREVLILLNSLADQQATSHQLVRLAQRIPSRIPLKQTSNLLEPPVLPSDYLLVVDRTHILRIDAIDQYAGWLDLNFASRAQKYAASLLQQWPRAREITAFRQFIL